MSTAASASGYGEAAYISVRKLPDVLRWIECPEFVDEVRRGNRVFAAARIEHIVSYIREHNPALSRSIAETLQKLPTSGASRFSTAPETAHRAECIGDDPVTHVRFLCRALNAETLRNQSLASPHAEGCWTALGDLYFFSEAELAGQRRSGAVVHDPYRESPVAGQAPIDFISPNVRNAMGALQARCSDLSSFLYGEPEQADIVRSLNASVETIRQVSTSVAGIVEEFTKVIIPFRTSSGIPASSSDRSYPGRVVLRNPELTDQAQMASYLVHEMIHQLLYIIELDKQFITSASAQLGSPWSGRRLAVRTYIHACFVWFGLVYYWRRAALTKVYPAEAAARELDQCLSGFLREDPAEKIRPHAACIRPDAVEVLATLRDEVRKDF